MIYSGLKILSNLSLFKFPQWINEGFFFGGGGDYKGRKQYRAPGKFY